MTSGSGWGAAGRIPTPSRPTATDKDVRMATDLGRHGHRPPERTDRLRRSGTSPLDRIQHVLHANPILGPLAVLVVAIIAFAIVDGRFLSAANLSWCCSRSP